MNYRNRFNKLAATGIIVVSSLLITSCGAEAPADNLGTPKADLASSVKVIHNDSNFDAIHAAKVADEVRATKKKQEAVAAAKAAEVKKAEEDRLAAEAQAQAEAVAVQEAADAEAYRVQQEAVAQEQAPVIPAPQAPVEQQAPAAPVVPVNNDVNIYVGTVGGQAQIDACAGPVLMDYPMPIVAEHDSCGGWGRFSPLSPGMIVNLSGVIGGRYKITGSTVIPSSRPDRPISSDIIPERFGSWPSVTFQSCIPGTDTTLLVAAMAI